MKYDDDIYSQLTEFGLTLVETLRHQVTPEGQIIDPGRDVPVPDSHYANTCFAVAGFRAAERTGSKDLRRAAQRSLQYYLDLNGKERGHGEFNAFALLELILDVREGQYEIPVSEAQLTDAIEFESTIDSQQGNNWLLLRGLCHYRLADLLGNWRDRFASRRIRRVVKYWSQNDGILADAPRYPVAPAETPLTYHAKLSSLCAHLGSEADDEWLIQAALDGFRALSTATLPSGEALYYGRSENTLFGYSTALAGAFRLSDGNSWLSDLRYRLSSYLLSSFDPKQAFCLPGGTSARSVDEYVYDGVYSAYAAMLLLGLQEGRATPSKNTEIGTNTQLETSGLTAATGDTSALGMATDGQVKFTNGVPDARYAGLVPLSFTIQGERVCPGVPSSFIIDRTPPYLPVAVRDTDRYVPVTWSGQQEQTNGRLTFMGDGSFYRATQHSSPSDNSRKSRVGGWLSVPTLCRYVGRKMKIPLYLERRQKRPENIPVEVRRTIHFLAESDVLVIQTATVTNNEWAVLPTSFVVNPSFKPQTTVTYADSTISKRAESVSTHQGVGTWIQPERTAKAGEHWSTIVVDPNGVTSNILTERCGERLQTIVEIDGCVSTLELHLPKSAASQTE